jgi:hypothetical protein
MNPKRRALRISRSGSKSGSLTPDGVVSLSEGLFALVIYTQHGLMTSSSTRSSWTGDQAASCSFEQEELRLVGHPQ